MLSPVTVARCCIKSASFKAKQVNALTHIQLYKVRTRSLVTNMASDSTGSRKSRIGVCQVTCTADKTANFEMSKDLIKEAKRQGAKMIFLPEACDYIADTKQQSMEMSESLEGETITQFCKLAATLDVWLSIGSFHQKGNQDSQNPSRLYNTHVIIDNKGDIKDTYSKIHLFDLDIPGKVNLRESSYTIPGETIQAPVDTPVGKVGMGICYDLRFPEMSTALRGLGAEILTYPSAFTVPTGQAHWKVMLRNRAIESQCYVVAAAQTGNHNNKRESYGHSLVVDPWGKVLVDCDDEVKVAIAEIDLDYLDKVRGQMPVCQHKRKDVYGEITLNHNGCIRAVDSQQQYQFGQFQIASGQVFYRSALSYAFVNIKPVVAGHVLVSPLRASPRLNDLSPEETADLFNTVQVVSKVIQRHFEVSSLTVAVQDGPEAGQTVKHVHVHIMPRRNGDFPQNDDIYSKLEKHDRDLGEYKAAGRLRSEEEMDEEACQLRSYFD